MYKNILSELEEVKEGTFKLNSDCDVIRVKGTNDISLLCYDSDGNMIGKIPVI